jgi:hypothetical protein
MSTNCIRCVVKRRTGPDLLCDDCRSAASAYSEAVASESLDHLKEEANRALRCLYIAVESSVAVDVNAKVRAYIAALEREVYEH